MKHLAQGTRENAYFSYDQTVTFIFNNQQALRF